MWPALLKSNVPAITQKFMYKAPWKKLQVCQSVRLVKDIDEGCAWCGAQETVYDFVKSCPMVRSLYAACRDVTTPVVQGVDVGKWVADNPMISLTPPSGLYGWSGLHRLWTVRCQKAVRRMEVSALNVVMAFKTTYMEAAAWFGNTDLTEGAHTAEVLAVWLWPHKQHTLAKDPAVDHARRWAAKTQFAAVGQQEAQEWRTKQQRKEKAQLRKREWQHIQRDGWVISGFVEYNTVLHPERRHGQREERAPRGRAARKLLCRGGWHGRPTKEGGGRGFQKWASVPGRLFCARTDVAAKGAGTQILARKFFSRKNFPPHMCSQNDQRDVGIILSHVCWGRTHPPAQQVGQRQPKPPSRHGNQGGGGGGWANGLPCHPPPPRQSNFLPAQTTIWRRMSTSPKKLHGEIRKWCRTVRRPPWISREKGPWHHNKVTTRGNQRTLTTNAQWSRMTTGCRREHI